jgi:hypothetical protein
MYSGSYIGVFVWNQLPRRATDSGANPSNCVTPLAGANLRPRSSARLFSMETQNIIQACCQTLLSTLPGHIQLPLAMQGT